MDFANSPLTKVVAYCHMAKLAASYYGGLAHTETTLLSLEAGPAALWYFKNHSSLPSTCTQSCSSPAATAAENDKSIVINKWHNGAHNLKVAKENQEAKACAQAKASDNSISSGDKANESDEDPWLFRGNPEKQKQKQKQTKLSDPGSDFEDSIMFQPSATNVSGDWTAFRFGEDEEVDEGDKRATITAPTRKMSPTLPASCFLSEASQSLPLLLQNTLDLAAPSTLVVWEQPMIALRKSGGLIGLDLYIKVTFLGLCDAITDAKTLSIGFDARNSTRSKKRIRGHSQPWLGSPLWPT
ncbi:uncharacterized protein FSUBG_765 [Fusarium subglutinans]|uniref:Uncharacterized protein n=1 Tax=Gibberella subglutinans TaxID=42677 RepID=A0A8H5QD18_GIBSU|nr:uncharacterized protein FSUBG_765 [Fusarium subglutinans]KAF5613556.1 hypothetical protein FSUBG_765 [Fusarium subglutinans]